MLKLLNVDASGERALRVVSYFDQLALHHPDVEAVVRSTAILADCSAGFQFADDESTFRFNPDGIAIPGSPTERSSTSAVALEDQLGADGLAWLERKGAPAELDDFIVERMALTIAGAIQRRGASRDVEVTAGFSDPALVQLLVNERANEAERSRAARLIGLEPSSKIQVIAVSAPRDHGYDAGAMTNALRSALNCAVYVAQLSGELLIAVVASSTSIDWRTIEFTARACIGPVVDATDAPSSWREARECLRFAGISASWPDRICSADVGALRLLASLPEAALLAERDIAQIETVRRGERGEESIKILDYFLHSDSIRAAARDANFHHSSLQSRLTKIGNQIGIDLKSGVGRQRAAHALLLWQLHQR